MRASLLLLLISLTAAQAQMEWIDTAVNFVKEAAKGLFGVGKSDKRVKENKDLNGNPSLQPGRSQDAEEKGDKGGLGLTNILSKGKELIQNLFGKDSSQTDQETKKKGRTRGNSDRY